MTIALTKYNQFSIGVERTHDGMSEGLCTVHLSSPITSKQLQEITDMIQFYICAILPGHVQVDDLLDHIRSILGNGVRITKDLNIEYYGNNDFCQGCIHVKPIFSIYYNNTIHHHVFDGNQQHLKTFLDTVQVA